MKIYDVHNDKYVDSVVNKDVFVYGTEEAVNEVLTQQHVNYKARDHSRMSSINYDVHNTFSTLSIGYYEFQEGVFSFTTLNFVIAEHMVVYIIDEENSLNKQFIENFVNDKLKDDHIEDRLQELFYTLISSALKNMFQTLIRYETYISEIEDEMLITRNVKNLEEIVSLKNMSLNIKKYNQQLLYIGDLLVLNEGSLDVESRYLMIIDASINKLYEYSTNIFEMTTHLMELYDSKLTANTNDVINKLTIFTVFATPLTVITGIYGMNFVNMPELHHAYGYYYAIGTMIIIDLIIYIILKKMKLL